MAKFHAHEYFLVFVALVACHGSLLTHGRKINIKPMNQDSSPSTNTPQPHFSSLKTNVESAQYEEASSLEDSGADNANAFRSTTPGGSPGVGHRMITSEDKKMKSTVAVDGSDVKVFVSEVSKEDFKPTDPGHSPGVGHPSPNKIGLQN
ncbi:hypothetical protein VNO78_26691 [Psophocarpus tetragonolobus]|uniref:Encoded peptide n=1 Tax=Psophocarpus tetragonolobus TaxID=3891 RepID=A0AAN9RZN9_PSOTE